jgi:hypothetical protein
VQILHIANSDKFAISSYLISINKKDELDEKATVSKMETVQNEGGGRV